MSFPRALLLALFAMSIAVSPASGGPSLGGYSSENVEWVKHVPFQNDAAGGRLLDGFFYVTTSRGLTIYDVSDPLEPRQVSFLPLPQHPYFSEEDPDTNGKILLVGSFDTLYVIDVEDKTAPKILSRLPSVDNHTISCVLDCRWGYGSEGDIVDLRDPGRPRLAGNWQDGLGVTSWHDVTEVAPGVVLTATKPIYLLDARRDPGSPKVLAMGNAPQGIHGVAWPDRARDRIMLAGGETFGPRCDEPEDATLMTWDTRGWRSSGTFRLIDEYRVRHGVLTEGRSPADLFCAHWFEPHPDFVRSRTLAMAWYEHGTRFFHISRRGSIEEVGYFIAFAGSTSAPYWVTDEVLYAVDYHRGIDILRFDAAG